MLEDQKIWDMADYNATIYLQAITRKHRERDCGSLAEQAIRQTNNETIVMHYKNGFIDATIRGYNLADLFNSHIDWAATTFPKQTSVGALTHMVREAQEVAHDIHRGASYNHKVEEYADCLGCLLSSMSCEGITVEALALAFSAKLEKNKGRQWIDNGDGSYSHVKSESEQPAVGDPAWLYVVIALGAFFIFLLVYIIFF